MNTILLQINEKMTSFDSDMQGISTFLFYSPTVQTYNNADDILDQVLMNRELLSVFANTMSIKPNIRGIQLYDRNGKLLTRLGEGQDETTAPVQKMTYSGSINLDARPTKHFYTIFSPILKSAKVTANSRVMLLDRDDHSLSTEGKVTSSDSVNVFRMGPQYVLGTGNILA